MSIAQEIININSELPSSARLVAVSKFHPAESVMEAYNAGQRIFGESRPQELSAKAPVLPSDIEWHFIGHLQTNKLKMVIPYVSLIHSVDSKRLLMEINKYAVARGLKVNCLLELFVATEESKQGFSQEELYEILDEVAENPLEGVELCGLMGMASFTDDEDLIRSEFKKLSGVFNSVRTGYPDKFPNFNQLSMGMSNDYRIALEYGSTLVRIGTRIFGERVY
ncbi:MAG: YggS family pyridoxal phosphate-dependent enzyme [Bacteroidales bacterium]|nr:YggS family pyridoxal phosphate-dependent enzyme [Bacteroidales bacterium]